MAAHAIAGPTIVTLPSHPRLRSDGGAVARPGAPMTTHPELPVEQAYLDRAYAHLARMRARTKEAASITSPRPRPSTR